MYNVITKFASELNINLQQAAFLFRDSLVPAGSLYSPLQCVKPTQNLEFSCLPSWFKLSSGPFLDSHKDNRFSCQYQQLVVGGGSLAVFFFYFKVDFMWSHAGISLHLRVLKALLPREIWILNWERNLHWDDGQEASQSYQLKRSLAH